MAVTTVDIVAVDGGSAQIINNGSRIGDSTRLVTVQATPATGYQFDRWEITIQDSTVTVGGGDTTFTCINDQDCYFGGVPRPGVFCISGRCVESTPVEEI